MPTEFPVEPFAYYHIRFATAPTNLWAVTFFDKAGNELPDCYDRLPAMPDYFVRAHALATRAAIQLPAQVQLVTNRSAVTQWADAIAAANPPLRYTPPPGPKLPPGKTVRIVALGDSIVNDMSNSAIDALLERAFPGTRIEWVNSVRGATGCPYYKDHVPEYVLSYRPDFVIIGGISHGYDAASIASVIDQIRAHSTVPILVLTGAIAPEERCRGNTAKISRIPRATLDARAARFPDELAQVIATHRVSFLDLRAEWDRYLAESGQPAGWFMRDELHANSRGKQVLARILLRYFTGKAD